jgi:hypothetical protein
VLFLNFTRDRVSVSEDEMHLVRRAALISDEEERYSQPGSRGNRSLTCRLLTLSGPNMIVYLR